jgi:hypothetical protein
MNSYQILKNGEPMGIQGTFDYIVNAIRNLESNFDRATQHSPFTIELINTKVKITNTLV